MSDIKYFKINIELQGRRKTLVVTNDTLNKNIKSKMTTDIELIYNGEILEDDDTIGKSNIREEDTIYAFYNTHNKKGTELIDIFQNIIQTYTQNTEIPINHYTNILTSIMNIQSDQNNIPLDGNIINQYTNELDILSSLGFENRDENLLLLQLYNGNVDYVANLLLGIE